MQTTRTPAAPHPGDLPIRTEWIHCPHGCGAPVVVADGLLEDVFVGGVLGSLQVELGVEHEC